MTIERDKQAHQQLLESSMAISERLHQSIQHTGPVSIEPRVGYSLAATLCRSLVGQQLSVAAASTIWSRLLDNTDGINNLTSGVVGSSDQHLRQCGLSAAKVKAIRGVAEADQHGLLDEDELRGISHEARANRLKQFWGIGQWTADMVNISYFGEPDIWPDQDLTVVKTLTQLTSRRRKTLRTASIFKPYRTYLALHMWRAADALPIK